ncbi:hypothetical protein LP419_03835 [Massilia sp. H-1]|nr:hypothetical protein LP419_03835 [Massilia sp. H-1]
MPRLQQGDRTCQRACRASGARRGRSQPDRPARRGQDRTSARHRQRQRHDPPAAAINDALKTAIMQVNGTQVQATTATLNTFSKITGQLDVETGGESDSLKATATVQSSHFAESIVAQSQGVVSAFKVLKMSPAKHEQGRPVQRRHQRHRREVQGACRQRQDQDRGRAAALGPGQLRHWRPGRVSRDRARTIAPATD